MIRFARGAVLALGLAGLAAWSAPQFLGAASAPEVRQVDPPRAARGGSATLKVTGSGFAKDVKVAFSNPGIQVLSTIFKKSSELSVSIRVSPDAPTGATSLFVVSPDESEAEAAFEVTEATAVSSGAPASPSNPAGGAPTASATPTAKSRPGALQFNVLSLGDVANILKAQGRASGTLAYSLGQLVYTENGKQVFAAKRADVQEVAPNTLLGISTGSFHVILRSGKTYNFIAPSLRPGDTQSIVEALLHALR